MNQPLDLDHIRTQLEFVRTAAPADTATRASHCLAVLTHASDLLREVEQLRERAARIAPVIAAAVDWRITDADRGSRAASRALIDALDELLAFAIARASGAIAHGAWPVTAVPQHTPYADQLHAAAATVASHLVATAAELTTSHPADSAALAAHRLAAQHIAPAVAAAADCCRDDQLGFAVMLAAELARHATTAQADERDRAVRLLARPGLNALRCIPDGTIQRGCLIHDGATVREQLRQAYLDIRDGADPR